jgi:PAS domain S-box-containing protein
MLEDVIQHPDVNEFKTTFKAGETVILEGDASEDLYILVSGALDVLKGNKVISTITGAGSFFGEMSFLLGAKRTATIKAKEDVTAIRIPKHEVTTFLGNFPDVGMEISKALARRLDETSQMFYGFREFCDQMPDAVIFTDKEERIRSWNTAAEMLYGQDGQKMKNEPIEALYEDSEAFREVLAEVKKGSPVREKMLSIKHPDRGRRYVSISATMLHDGHHNFRGVLCLSRDVTAVESLERKYQRARRWFLPGLIMLVLLSTVVLLSYPFVSKRYKTVSVKEQELRDQLVKDYLLLKSLLLEGIKAGDRDQTSRLLEQALKFQEEASTIPYNGIVLLDKNKNVFDAYSAKMGPEAMETVGATYSGIDFHGDESSFHKVLSLYRADEGHPMGTRGVELAFELREHGAFLGWMVFQMDTDLLRDVYGIDEEGLKELRFESPD